MNLSGIFGGKLLVAFLALALGFPSGPVAHYRTHGKVKLNDLAATPGVVDSIDAHKVCTTKWGADERHVTPKMKDASCAAYGLEPHCYGRETNEIDHLISRELGGADDAANIWPQPYNEHPGAHEKDAVENWLHKQVCSGKMELQEAQRSIATDWYAVYLQMNQYPAGTKGAD